MNEQLAREEPHAQALFALLRQTGLTVFPSDDAPPEGPGSPDGIVPPKTPPPYVAVHTAFDRPIADRATFRSTEGVLMATVHCVGATAGAAQNVADLVARALLDVRPVIAGRRCWPIRLTASDAARPDKSTGVLVVTRADVYRLRSTPA